MHVPEDFFVPWYMDSWEIYCSDLRKKVIIEKDIYRPAAWNAFGMDKEGADFRACKNYGPLYK